jgi:hypothetical protein
MTSQVLVQNYSSNLGDCQPTTDASQPLEISASSDASLSNPSHLSQAQKLTYQANHQVELLHLQAETEALLQQLQTLKQQRLVSAHQASSPDLP